MKDLTKGNPIITILLFAIPLALGQLFQQFYSLVDVSIVGSVLGEIPLAAVGASTAFSDFLVGFLNGFCNGFAIVVAMCFGSGDMGRLKKVVAASYITGIVLAVILTVISLGFLDRILKLLNVEASLTGYAKDYIIIIIAGLIFSVLYNTCAAVLRGIGDSVTPLLFLILSSVLNIVLDLFFITVLHMGVSGASAATVLSQAVSAFLCILRIIHKYPALHISREDIVFEKKLYSDILSTGLSMGLMISIVNLGTLFLQSAINSFNPYVVVAHTSARKITMILMLPNGVFGSALAAFSGQNFGSGRYDRIRKGCTQTILLICIWDILALILVWLAGKEIIHLVSASSNEEVLYWGSLYLRTDLCFYFLCTTVCCIRNTLQGMGHSMTTIISSMMELLTKVLIAFLLVPVAGYLGIIWCEPIAWFLMLIPLLVKWIQINHKNERMGNSMV